MAGIDTVCPRCGEEDYDHLSGLSKVDVIKEGWLKTKIKANILAVFQCNKCNRVYSTYFEGKEWYDFWGFDT